MDDLMMNRTDDASASACPYPATVLLKPQERRNHPSPTPRTLLLRSNDPPIRTPNRDQILHSFRIELIEPHPTALLQLLTQIHNIDLTRPIRTRAGPIIRSVEEYPHPLAIQRQCVSFLSDDADRPLHIALRDIRRSAAGEVRVVPGGIRGPGEGSAGEGLPVGSFDLHECREDIPGVVELVGVEGVVFGARADEPGGLGGFDEGAAAGADLLDVFRVEVVVGGPEPGVFNVGRAGFLEVEDEEGGFAGVGNGLTGGFEEGVGGSSDSVVGVVEGDVALIGTGHVDFHEDRSGEDVCDGEEHVGELCYSDFTWPAYLNHGTRIAVVFEFIARSCDCGPDFANDSTT